MVAEVGFVFEKVTPPLWWEHTKVKLDLVFDSEPNGKFWFDGIL